MAAVQAVGGRRRAAAGYCCWGCRRRNVHRRCGLGRLLLLFRRLLFWRQRQRGQARALLAVHAAQSLQDGAKAGARVRVSRPAVLDQRPIRGRHAGAAEGRLLPAEYLVHDL